MSNVTTQDTDSFAQQKEQTAALAERYAVPRASVYEAPDAVILDMEMPGVPREQVQISVENDELTVTGRRIKDAGEDLQIFYQERPTASFRRSFILNEGISVGEITASMENGVLRLTMPKSAKAKPRKIEIS
jgi:HSP20 family protein